MCNPDCILSVAYDENLVARVDELVATPEFQADIEEGFDFCEALQRAQNRPLDAA